MLDASGNDLFYYKNMKIMNKMKWFLLTAFAATFITGCSKDGVIDTNGDELGKSKYNDGTAILPGWVDGIDGVSTWQKESEITFTDEYSIIDTLIADRVISREVIYECNENENVHVKWSVNGIIQSNTKEARRWDGDTQKWIVTNTAILNIDRLSQDIKIEAIVAYPNRSVRRAKTIHKVVEKKNVSDIFGFTFGTHRKDMSKYITYDHSPNFAYASGAYHHLVLYFGFAEGKLTTLYQIVSMHSYVGSDRLSDLCNLCKIPNTLTFSKSENYKVDNPQEWTYKQLKFKVHNMKMKDLFDTSTSDDNIICFSIEKK